MPLRGEGRGSGGLSAIQVADEADVKRLDIMKALEADDIESRPVWKPMHLQPVFHDCDFVSEIENLHIVDEEMGADNSIAGTLFRRGVCMPSDTKMTKEDMKQVCGVVRKLWE